jgi:cyclic-di-GMP phosphodiesterase, flagellum assembly factor TipF
MGVVGIRTAFASLIASPSATELPVINAHYKFSHDGGQIGGGLAAPRRLWTLLWSGCESLASRYCWFLGFRGIVRRGAERGLSMVRISAIFIAVCMVLIAGSLGYVVYLRFGLTGAESALFALGVLTALGVYNTVAARTRDRSEVSDQITTLARGSDDLARQLSEFGRRLGGVEAKAEAVLDKTLALTQPLATEIAELSTLVKQLADQVAAHEIALAGTGGKTAVAPAATAARAAAATETPTPTAPADAVPTAQPVAASPTQTARPVAAFAGLDKDAIIAAIKSAIDGSKIDLYLQPIVTLPQRKVRYYEAMSRLKADNADVVAAGDFLSFAEAGSLMPKLDNLSVMRCVQVVRRLLLKNREIGLFCNLSMAMLTDAGFPHFVEFIDANRAIASALVFEFTQRTVRSMGPIEHESLAALAERGYRFSMDNLTDLRIEPRELTERGFRFIKAPATLLLNRVGAAASDIHPADFSDLLGRFGIDLIADRIEAENMVVDLLDFDVRFGQGFLFSPPRPVRAEALQGAGEAGKDAAVADAGKTAPGKSEPLKPAPSPSPQAGEGREGATRNGTLAQLARAGSART